MRALSISALYHIRIFIKSETLRRQRCQTLYDGYFLPSFFRGIASSGIRAASGEALSQPILDDKDAANRNQAESSGLAATAYKSVSLQEHQQHGFSSLRLPDYENEPVVEKRHLTRELRSVSEPKSDSDADNISYIEDQYFPASCSNDGRSRNSGAAIDTTVATSSILSQIINPVNDIACAPSEYTKPLTDECQKMPTTGQQESRKLHEFETGITDSRLKTLQHQQMRLAMPLHDATSSSDAVVSITDRLRQLAHEPFSIDEPQQHDSKSAVEGGLEKHVIEKVQWSNRYSDAGSNNKPRFGQRFTGRDREPQSQQRRPDVVDEPQGQWRRSETATEPQRRWRRSEAAEEEPQGGWRRPQAAGEPRGRWPRPHAAEEPQGRWPLPEAAVEPQGRWRRPETVEKPRGSRQRADNGDESRGRWQGSETTVKADWRRGPDVASDPRGSRRRGDAPEEPQGRRRGIDADEYV